MVDVLYLVKDLDDDALQRLRMSLLSIHRSNENPNITVSDASGSEKIDENVENIKSVFASIGAHIPIFTKNPQDGPFNRSKAINDGMRSLLNKGVGPVLVMDVDIVVPAGFLDDILLRFYETGGQYVLGWIAYLREGHPITHKYEELRNAGVDREYHSGFFMCDKVFFKCLNGFDEDYVGWGGEDEDFTARAKLLVPDKVHQLRGDTLMCYHQWHKVRYQSEYSKPNKERYFDRKAKYQSGELRVSDVRGLVKWRVR